MTDKLPKGEARKIIMKHHGSGKTTVEVGSLAGVDASYVGRIWREYDAPTVLQISRMRRGYNIGTGTMFNVLTQLTNEEMEWMYKEAETLGISLPVLVASVIRDAAAPPEPEKEPTAKPSINWDHVGGEFNTMATDEGGLTWLYERSPILGINTWFKGGWTRLTHDFTSFKPGTCDWKDSLVLRPGYEEPKP